MLYLLRPTGVKALTAVAFLNAFVDLGHKVTLQNTVFKVFDGPEQIALSGLINALILLPFVMLLSPAGFLSDRFSKTLVLRRTAALAVPISLALTLCYYLGWFYPALGLTFALALQSAIYAPAKLGTLRQLVGTAVLVGTNGLLQAATTAAILLSMMVFSFGFEFLVDPHLWGDPRAILRSAAPLGWILVAGTLAEYQLTRRLPILEDGNPALSFDFGRYRRGIYLREALSSVWQRPVLRLSVIGLAVFWSIAQVLVAVYPAFAESFLGMSNVATIQLIMAAASVGVCLGALLTAGLSRGHVETGLIPLGAGGVALSLALLSVTPEIHFQALLFGALGLSGALFIVPLNALVQFHAAPEALGRTLAASGFLNHLMMLGFLALTVLFALLGFGDRLLLALLTIVAIVGAVYTVSKLPQSLVRLGIARAFAFRYRLRVIGIEQIPRAGGVLLLGNHVSWIDWAIVAMASPRPVRFVMARSIYERWYLRRFLDFMGVIPIARAGSKASLETVAASLDAGDVVCLFPEGAISRHGQLNEFKSGFERALAQVTNANTVVVPFYLRGLWGSQFSYAAGALQARSARGPRRDIIVTFGQALPQTCHASGVKQAIAELSITGWQQFVETLPSIPRMWLRQSRRGGSQVAVIESTGRKISRSALNIGVLCFARLIRKRSPGPRVGILLPASGGGAIVNMAALLAGKTIVNLNFTAAPTALAASIRSAGLTEIYSSSQFLERLEQRGIEITEATQGCTIYAAEDLRATLGPLDLLRAWLSLKLLPSRWIAALYGAERDPDATAAILFSSGSEGLPKGVMLSHRNLLANIAQTTDMLNPVDEDVIVGCLPLFHAFGLTVTTLLPMLECLPLITHPDPTDAPNLARAIYEYRGTVLCGTSTFLRLYARNPRVLPLMLEPLRLVVAGAERLDPSVRESFTQKFNKTIYEGYGATETTPVASVNVPDYLDAETWTFHAGSRIGTVGMPLPGSCFRIVDPDTHETLPTGIDGLILIGGVQVMLGYLDDPARTAEAIVKLDGQRWYRTGDKGHLDEDGFLTIVDRYSRFAKLGGEMVSLGAVEQAITRALVIDIEVVVVSVPDPRKGERLVAIVPSGEEGLDIAALRQQLREAGLPALMVPDQWLAVEVMPKLGSGKTDFTAARAIALTHSA